MVWSGQAWRCMDRYGEVGLHIFFSWHGVACFGNAWHGFER